MKYQICRRNLKYDEPQDYDLHEAPQSAGGGPLLIEASINLSNILEVKMVDMMTMENLKERFQKISKKYFEKSQRKIYLVRNPGGRKTATDKS